MPDKCNNPYNLNLNYERKTYEMIGKDYIKTKSSRLNNLLFDVLKGFIGENSREYKVCNTYLDWKVYVFSEFTVMAGKFPEGQKRNEFLINFEHWLIRISRSAKTNLSVFEAVMIPLFITMLSFLNYRFEALVIYMLVVEFILLTQLVKMKSKIDFYDDYISLLQSFKKSELK